MSKKLVPIRQATVYSDFYCPNNVSLLKVWITSGYFENNILVTEFHVPRKKEWTSTCIDMFEVIKKRLRHEGYVFDGGHYGSSTGTYKQFDTLK